ncbi:MAG: hypothetical protein ACQESR_01425 [Planctomycetota bacterium]
MQRKIARWVIDHDPHDTRRCYAQLPVGTNCTCNQCKNFDAAVGRVFPTEFVALLDSLGIDPTKPADLCHYSRERSSLYLTGGWFHFVGSIVVGDDAIHWENNTGTFRFEQLGSRLAFGLTGRLALVREAFAGMPLVQLEFQTCVPWVLAEPEPEA